MNEPYNTHATVSRPYLGFGLGLRPEHYQTILNEKPAIDWFEILTENYLVPGGRPLYFLDKISQFYPVVMHGVSLSIGSTDPLNWDYLASVKQLMQRISPQWISDHLCWTGVNNKNTHDLLPLPYTEEAILHVVSRIKQVQDFLGRQILLENISSYITYQHSTIPEWEFLREVCEQADCLILLDLNNIYVNSINHHFDPKDYLAALPSQRIQQIHMAGHSHHGNYRIDTHDAAVIEPVWDLYRSSLQRFGLISLMIERDEHIPPLADLMRELTYAKEIALNVWGEIANARDWPLMSVSYCA